MHHLVVAEHEGVQMVGPSVEDSLSPTRIDKEVTFVCTDGTVAVRRLF